MLEQYTLILRHEAVYGEDRVQLDPPLILKAVYDRKLGGSPVFLNDMLDRFKGELIRRECEWKGGE